MFFDDSSQAGAWEPSIRAKGSEALKSPAVYRWRSADGPIFLFHTPANGLDPLRRVGRPKGRGGNDFFRPLKVDHQYGLTQILTTVKTGRGVL